jgi:hypothetical protein
MAAARLAPEPTTQAVEVRDAAGRVLCIGKLEGDSTVVKLRELAEGMGLQVEWDASVPAAILRFPGKHEVKEDHHV